MTVVGEILHLQGSFHGALGLNNCVRYRCNRPRLYLTEEHSIRWKFFLVNHKLFHLVFSERRRFDLFFHPLEDQRKLTACHSVQKCTEKLFRKSFWEGTGALDAILSQINKKIGNRFHFR